MLPGNFPTNLLSAALIFAALEIAACLVWSRKRAISLQPPRKHGSSDKAGEIGGRLLIWGGVAVSIGAAEMAAKGISERLSPSILLESLFLGWLWGPILFTQEILALGALIQALSVLARKPNKEKSKIGRPLHFLVGLILSLLTARGFEIALFGEPPTAWSPVGHILANLFQGAGETGLKAGYILSWWACMLSALMLLLRHAAGEWPWRSPSLPQSARY